MRRAEAESFLREYEELCKKHGCSLDAGEWVLYLEDFTAMPEIVAPDRFDDDPPPPSEKPLPPPKGFILGEPVCTQDGREAIVTQVQGERYEVAFPGMPDREWVDEKDLGRPWDQYFRKASRPSS